MRWFVIIAVVVSLMAYGVYYFATGDQRAIDANAGPKEQQLTITLGRNEQLQDLIAAGTYGRVDSPILHATLPPGSANGAKIELTLLKLHYDFHSKEEALAALQAKGLVPARIEHMLALGAEYPDFHVFNQGSLIFLGTTLKDSQNEDSVPALSTNEPHELRLYHVADPLLIGPNDWIAGMKK